MRAASLVWRARWFSWVQRVRCCVTAARRHSLIMPQRLPFESFRTATEFSLVIPEYLVHAPADVSRSQTVGPQVVSDCTHDWLEPVVVTDPAKLAAAAKFGRMAAVFALKSHAALMLAPLPYFKGVSVVVPNSKLTPLSVTESSTRLHVTCQSAWLG